MEVHYDGDAERQAAHRRKLVDVGRHVQTWAGRTARTSTFLRANGQRGRAGTGCDTATWWAEGRIGAIGDACMRDVRALAEVALAKRMRGPGGGDILGIARARMAIVAGGGAEAAEEGIGRSGGTAARATQPEGMPGAAGSGRHHATAHEPARGDGGDGGPGRGGNGAAGRRREAGPGHRRTERGGAGAQVEEGGGGAQLGAASAEQRHAAAHERASGDGGGDEARRLGGNAAGKRKAVGPDHREEERRRVVGSDSDDQPEETSTRRRAAAHGRAHDSGSGSGAGRSADGAAGGQAAHETGPRGAAGATESTTEAELPVEVELPEAAIATPLKRPQRTVPTPETYKQTKDRAKRKRVGHMMHDRQSTGPMKKRAIEIGAATVERTTRGRYEWRDAELGKRKRDDEQDREGKDGSRGLRPRDPGRRR